MDKALQREQTRERVKRYRNKQALHRPISESVTVDTKKAAKLLLLCKALDREVTGLDGKRVSLLTMVRYGILGQTLKEIKAFLTG